MKNVGNESIIELANNVLHGIGGTPFMHVAPTRTTHAHNTCSSAILTDYTGCLGGHRFFYYACLLSGLLHILQKMVTSCG